MLVGRSICRRRVLWCGMSIQVWLDPSMNATDLIVRKVQRVQLELRMDIYIVGVA